MQQIYEYIYAIYKAGSIRRAADNLHVTQPALSIALKKFEDEIGSRIFDRSSHPLHLTPAGEALIRHLTHLMRSEQRMLAEMKDFTDTPYGEMTIGSTHFFNTYILPSILDEYITRYPNVQIHILEESSHEILTDFHNGTADVIFFANNLEEPDLLHIPVLTENLLFVIPERYLPAEYRNRDAEAVKSLNRDEPSITELESLDILEHIPFIALNDQDLLFKQTMQLFETSGVHPRILLNIQQMMTAYSFACAGIGATIASATLALDRTSSKSNTRLFSFRSPLMQRTIFAGCSRSRYTTKAAQAFLEICRSKMKRREIS